MKTLARITSYIFHPLLFPTYGAFLILYTNPQLFGSWERTQNTWMIIVFALTFIFPVVWMLMMKGLNMVDSLQLKESKDRIIPLIATATFYLWATWMFKPAASMKIPPNLLIFYMMLGACFATFMALFFNVWTKISLHSIAAGSLFGLLMVLLRYSTYDLRIFFIAAILLVGFIGTARLILQAHSQREVSLGYLVGFTAQFLSFSIVPFFF